VQFLVAGRLRKVCGELTVASGDRLRSLQRTGDPVRDRQGGGCV